MSFSIKKTHGTLKRLSISGDETNNILELLAKESKENVENKESKESKENKENKELLKTEYNKKSNSSFSMKKTSIDYCSDYL